MAEENIPTGQLFSHVYLKKDKPLRDSQYFRKRIGHLCDSQFVNFKQKLKDYLIQELGVNYFGSFKGFFEEVSLPKMLDAITLVWRFLYVDGYDSHENNWRNFVERVLKEENMGYSLDEQCGVHFAVDEEFERNRISTLRCLENAKYDGVRKAFEHAFREMDATPPHTKDAIRSMFESLEILVKQMVSTDRLNKNSVNSLKPLIQKKLNDDPTAIRTAEKILDGFGHWVDGIHNYRHGQDEPTPVDPPIDLTVFVLSSGASYLRWLISIDYDETP